jgi:hypothetical protein
VCARYSCAARRYWCNAGPGFSSIEPRQSRSNPEFSADGVKFVLATRHGVSGLPPRFFSWRSWADSLLTPATAISSIPEVSSDEEHLSNECLFGKMIAPQDTMTRITAQKNKRYITVIVQRTATWVFLPI